MPASREETDPEATRLRRAFSVVSEHLRKATVGLETRGVSGRLLPGLWHACMGVVVSTMEPYYAGLLIEDRSLGIKGSGSNADAHPRELSGESLSQYLAEVTAAAEVLADLLSVALEVLQKEGLDEYFPECAMDAMVQVLVPAWGPVHVRRALGEQWVSLRAGSHDVVTVMEPSKLNVPARSQPADEHVPSPETEGAVPPPRRRSSTARFVESFADADVDPETGRGAWAVVISVHERGGRTEFREICGPLRDATARTSCISAVLEALRAIDESGGEAVVRLETPADFVIGAMAPVESRSDRARLPGETDSWIELDSLCARHAVDWKHVPEGTDRDLAERCDRLVRRVMTAGNES